MTLTKLLRTSAAALGALAVASGANAADMYAGGGLKEAPYVPPPLWTGFYIGAHIGAAWENINTEHFRYDDYGYGWSDYAPGFFNMQNNNQADAFGGAQLGYNYQFSPAWVAGIEVDLGGMDVNVHPHGVASTWWGGGPGTSALMDGESNGGFYGDVTGRLGWTWGPAMIYAKGGFAWLDANLKMRESVYDPWGGSGCYGWCDYNHNNSNTLTGWTVGGGLEWKVSPSWSIKAEYLHFDFTNFNQNCCNDYMYQWDSSYNNFNHNADLTVDTVKLGFNYFWNPAAPAPLK
jgi:outer membrane immunogenic protein